MKKGWRSRENSLSTDKSEIQRKAGEE